MVGVRVRGQGFLFLFFFQEKFGVEVKSGVNVWRFSNASKMIKVLAVEELEVLCLWTRPHPYWSHMKQFSDRSDLFSTSSFCEEIFTR